MYIWVKIHETIFSLSTRSSLSYNTSIWTALKVYKMWGSWSMLPLNPPEKWQYKNKHIRPLWLPSRETNIILLYYLDTYMCLLYQCMYIIGRKPQSDMKPHNGYLIACHIKKSDINQHAHAHIMNLPDSCWHCFTQLTIESSMSERWPIKSIAVSPQ